MSTLQIIGLALLGLATAYRAIGYRRARKPKRWPVPTLQEVAETDRMLRKLSGEEAAAEKREFRRAAMARQSRK